jgi:hypothetical protein
MTKEVSIPEQGAALIGWYWDESAQVRIDHPEKGAERNATFRVLGQAVRNKLGVLGLQYPSGLPKGKARAMQVAREHFTRQLEVRPLSRR